MNPLRSRAGRVAWRVDRLGHEPSLHHQRNEVESHEEVQKHHHEHAWDDIYCGEA